MASNAPRDFIKPICKNRRALHDYEVDDRLEAGIALVGSEVKSLRAGKGNLVDAYVRFKDGEAWLVGAHISLYDPANRLNHDPLRERKLLLHRSQVRRWEGRVKEKGYTVIPLTMYFKGPNVKVELGLGKGKQTHDKREAIRERDDRRDMDRTARQRDYGR